MSLVLLEHVRIEVRRGLATALNAETLHSATGEDWAAEMVRKLLG